MGGILLRESCNITETAMDLLALARLSGESEKRVTLEATVTTGLESVAMSECREKLAGLTEVCTARGRVYMNVDLDQMEQVSLSIRSWLLHRRDMV